MVLGDCSRKQSLFSIGCSQKGDITVIRCLNNFIKKGEEQSRNEAVVNKEQHSVLSSGRGGYLIILMFV